MNIPNIVDLYQVTIPNLNIPPGENKELIFSPKKFQAQKFHNLPSILLIPQFHWVFGSMSAEDMAGHRPQRIHRNLPEIQQESLRKSEWRPVDLSSINLVNWLHMKLVRDYGRLWKII